jgi:hypothetical protein
MSLSAETIARQRGLPRSGAVIIDIEKARAARFFLNPPAQLIRQARADAKLLKEIIAEFERALAAAELSPAGKDNRLQVIAWATEDALRAVCQWSDWFCWLDTLKKGRHDDRP